MRKLFSWLLSLAIIVSICPVKASATGKISLSTSKDGENITVTYGVEKYDSVGSMESIITFPKEVVELVSVTGNTFSPLDFESPDISNANTNGIVKLGYSNETMGTVTVSGTIATLKFKIIAGATPGDYAFTLTKVSMLSGDLTTDYAAADASLLPITAAFSIPKAPITSVTASVKAPEAGKALDFTGTVDSSAPYSITKVEWFESTNDSGTTVTSPATAKANQYYYARITLTANSGETFAASLDNTISGIYSVARNSETELYLTKVYQTGSLPAASVTDAPKANTGLKYNGAEQPLLGFVGNANGGTMQYSLDNSSWSADIPKGKDAKTYTVYYMAKGDGSHSDYTPTNNTVSVKIDPKDISGVTIGTIADQSYTGSAITPALEVKDGTATLTQDTDYTVSCSDIYVGNATLTITGKGNYTGEKKGVNFNIVAAEQNPRFTTPVDLVSGGHRLDLTTLVSGAKGQMSFTISGVTSTHAELESDGYTLTSTGISGTVNINVSITAKDEGGDSAPEYNAYTGTNAITVNVVNKTPASLTVTQADTTYGSALANPDYDTTNMIASSLRVTYKGRGTTSYTENTTMPNDAGTYTVKVTYETATEILSGTADFTISPKSISGMTVTLDKTSLEYNGGAQTVNVTSVGSLTAADYTVTSGNSGTDVNSYTVTVTGKDNYKDTAKATWKITPRDLIVTPEPNQSKKFGTEDPTLTFMPTGAVGGQTPNFTGKLSRADGEAVGQYDITLGTLAMTDNDSSGFKASNYTLKLNSTPVKFEIKKADAPTLPDISVSQKYNVTTEQSKDIGSAGMPEDAGALTYRADSSSVTTTGTATVSSFTVDSTGMVKYTITGGTKGEIITLPVTIESTNYADATVHVVITLTKPSYSGGTSYAITVEKAENGTVSADRGSASKGSTVTITVKPDKGYELDALKVLDKNGDKVKLTEKNGKYTFTMPAGKVTVKGSFVEEVLFDDVKVGDYFYEAVKWAVKKDITNGVGNDLFAPNQPCTRGQIVTFLWRAAGSPEAKAMSAFSDVADSAYYAKAVAWAVENGITGGTGNGKFSPDATCTRAQAVTFLYRAAGSPKVSGSAEFGDVATNAYYADAVAWAAKNGITGGIGGGLFGSDNDCTRAQIVTFLYRSVK